MASNLSIFGSNGILRTSQNTACSAELKKAAVEDYLAGGTSHMDICKRYGIKSTRQLRNWILNNKQETVERFYTDSDKDPIAILKE